MWMTLTLSPLGLGTVTLLGLGPKYAEVFDGRVNGFGQKLLLTKLHRYWPSEPDTSAKARTWV